MIDRFPSRGSADRPGVSRLQRADDPDERMRSEGLKPHPWTAGPGVRFEAHAHEATKYIYVSSGSISFDGQELRPGEGLMIPSGTVHSAVVGARGVTCVEAFTR